MNSKKFNIVINGKSYEILIGDVNSSPVSVFVDGVEYKVDLKENKNKTSQTQEENIPTIGVSFGSPYLPSYSSLINCGIIVSIQD